mgnify:CR=1 FL=1
MSRQQPARLQARLDTLRSAGRKALVPFVTAGDPSLAATVPVMHALVEAGADVIELGVPFSDPSADGPVIQKAGDQALALGIGLAQVYEQSLQNINADLSSVNTLAVAAGNGIYTDADRAALQQQAQGYLDNAQNTLQTASFGGVALFSNQDIAFNSGQSNLNLKVEDVGAALTAQNVFNIDLTTQAGAAAANTALTQATEYVSGLQAEAGASINSFAAQVRNLNNQQLNQAQARSRIEDTDFAKATADKVATPITVPTSFVGKISVMVANKFAVHPQ